MFGPTLLGLILAVTLPLLVVTARADQLDCAPPAQGASDLTCTVTLAPGGRVASASAESGTVTLPPVGISPAPWDGYAGAALLLVQTADSGPAEVEARLKIALRLVRAAPPHLRIGLASYGTELTMLAPIGSPVERFAALHPPAGGRETDLFRASLDGLKVLGLVPADRRTLVVLGSGRADDAAFSLTDVTRQAQGAAIAIDTVGLMTRPRESTLDVLRRLAEETGGRFIDPTAAAPTSGEIEALTSRFDGGARLSVSLAGAVGPDVLVRVKTEAGATLEARRPYTPPQPQPPQEEAPPPVPWGLVAAGIAAALAAIGLWLWLRRRPRPPMAWLQEVAGGRRHPVNIAAFRIGRAAGNELVLSDATVSAHHAVIRRRRDGSFAIIDLGAVNPVLVNGVAATQAPLRGGDRIDLGETSLRFFLAGGPVTLESRGI
jgi:hypothetical protein